MEPQPETDDNWLLPSRPQRALRVWGIDLGTTNSTVAEILWNPDAPGTLPQCRCLELDQPTTDGVYTGPLVPSVLAILPSGEHWIGEGQDLDAEAFGIFTRVARHVTVFADHQQQIFEGGASEEEILSALGLHRRNATLLAAYRNSRDVAALAACFISDETARRTYLAQGKNYQAIRERPLCYVATSLDDENDRMAEILHQRQVMNQQVGIIVPQVKHVHGLAKGLQERGITVEKALGGSRKRDAEAVQFDSLTPKIATYYSAKGLTFDCVLLPRLCESAFPRAKGEARQRLLFVGISRATQWVYLSTVAGASITEMNLLKEAHDNGLLVVQYSKAVTGQIALDLLDAGSKSSQTTAAANLPDADPEDDELPLF